MPYLSRNQIPPLLAVLLGLLLCALPGSAANARDKNVPVRAPVHLLAAGELAPDSYEPNDICEQATTIESNGIAQLHNFHHADDVDWLSIDVHAGERYHIAVDATTGVAIRMVGSCSLDGPLAAGVEAVTEQVESNASIIITAPANGQYHFSVGNNTPDATDTPTYRITVRQQLDPDQIGAVIIVAGRLRADDPLQQNMHNVTDAVYDLFRGYGYTDDEIYYLATDATLSGYDAAATRDNLRQAITTWAVSRVSADRYLTLYMIDASDRDLFLLDEPAGQRLTPDELDGWLTTLETAVPNLKINVILEHCYGATFIEAPGSISRAGRMIITSSDVNELAYASTNGAYFSDTFIASLTTGRTLYDAFASARDATLSATSQRQHAQLDGDGDGVPGDPLDKAVALIRVLFPYAGNATPTVTPTATATATPSPAATPSPTARPSDTPSPTPTPPPIVNATPTPTPTLTANPTAVQQAERGAVIIVAGRLNEGDEYQRNIHSVANRVYQIFRTHGYTDDDITYLATDATQPGYDGPATVESLRRAITEWAVTHVGANQPLTLYLIDHGLQERFYLDNVHGEILTPTQLDSWLNEFEAAVPTATVNVILEACFIGSFIEQPESISKPGRVIIASSNSRWGAYLSPDGAYFSDYFLTALRQGRTLQASFIEARDNVNLAHGSYAQIPWLDANGNSRPNEEADFAVAAQRSFSYLGSLNEDRLPPVIDEVTVQGADVDQDGQLNAVVRDNGGISTVWAMIYPPSYTPPTGEQGLFAETARRQPLISQGNNRYTIEEPHFTEVGTYHIVFHAQDGAGNVAQPVRATVAVGSQIFLPLVVQQ